MDGETSVGVIVGRFQVDQLHEGHKALINQALKDNQLVSIVLGIGPLPTTARKPLPFETRVEVIRNSFPNRIINQRLSFLPLEDHPDDNIWSLNLDKLIKESHHHSWDIKLYHSRDSFKEVYTGEFPTIEVPHADIGISGTLHRQFIADNPSHTDEFAKGVIWANLNKFPTVYGTVDMAAFNLYGEPYEDIILITKSGRPGLMFPGGFADPNSPSDEEDANRELQEETGIESYTPIEYVGSRKVEDWRYAGESDCLRTRMFITEVGDKYGSEPTAGDDAETAKWYKWKELTAEDFNPCHRPLYEMLKDYLKGLRTNDYYKHRTTN